MDYYLLISIIANRVNSRLLMSLHRNEETKNTVTVNFLLLSFSIKIKLLGNTFEVSKMKLTTAKHHGRFYHFLVGRK